MVLDDADLAYIAAGGRHMWLTLDGAEVPVVADVTGTPSGPGRLTLADVRKRIGRSQAQVAHLMRTTQSGVSRIERQDDIRVSTLAEYASALGGQLHLILEFGDGSFELSVGGVDGRSDEEQRSFRVRATTEEVADA